MNRGEVWWVEQPDHGGRPAMVLTRQEAVAVLTAVLVVPATRTIRDIPTELRLGVEDGMPTECVLSFDNLVTVPKAMLTERITTLSVAHLDEACRRLAIATGCGGPA